MPRLAANLSFLFNEVPFPERFRAAAEAGFGGVEYQFPDGHRPQELRERLDAAGLQQVLLNMPAGDWAGGERGLTCLPGRQGEFRDGVGLAIEYARALGCPRVHVIAGLAPEPGPERTPYEDAYRDNLAYAADRFAAAGIAALVEPINVKRDVPGFFMRTTAQARAVMRELGRPNIRLQFDAYHVQVSEGDLVHTFRACLPDIGHIQIANPPDRQEPDRGEVDYGYFLGVVDASGYDGWVAGEYKPRGRTADGLAWGRRWGLRSRSAEGTGAPG